MSVETREKLENRIREVEYYKRNYSDEIFNGGRIPTMEELKHIRRVESLLTTLYEVYTVLEELECRLH